jgi:hypothetical protein
LKFLLVLLKLFRLEGSRGIRKNRKLSVSFLPDGDQRSLVVGGSIPPPYWRVRRRREGEGRRGKEREGEGRGGKEREGAEAYRVL